MNPISRERADFVIARIRVLSAMYLELLNKPAKYISAGQNELHRLSLNQIQAEKIQLTIELEVLTAHLGALTKDASPTQRVSHEQQ